MCDLIDAATNGDLAKVKDMLNAGKVKHRNAEKKSFFTQKT